MSTSSNVSPATPEPAAHREFFVGYLPVPRGIAGFLRWLLPAALGTAAVIGISVAAMQRDSGTGVWEEGSTASLEGVVVAEPYAMIRVPGNASNELGRTILLVSSGKFGAKARVRPFDGQAARVTGTILHRDDRWMLELDDGNEAIQPLAAGNTLLGRAQASTAPATFGQVTLRGEIIDPKCYIGAMKPGGGKTHKACAQLCVGGGIPPMLVTRDAHRTETFYLLSTADGQEANTLVLPYLGDPVEVSGRLERRGDLWVIRADANGIRRL